MIFRTRCKLHPWLLQKVAKDGVDWSKVVLVVSGGAKQLSQQCMTSMKLAIPLHSLYWSIHTKDESKRGTMFAFVFGVN